VRRKLTFGLYALEPERQLGALLNTFCEWLGDQLDADIACDEALDYETLAERVRTRSLDIAWLPPIVLLRVGDDGVPVAAIRRGSRGGYETALAVRDDSPIRTVEDLRGKSAAWVDAWSAAGYVIPRLHLRLGGLDPTTLFREEHFYGTHSAAIRAVLVGEADVAGTYALRNEEGDVIDGPWSEIDGSRVRLLTTFGEIPPDVFAVSAGVEEGVRQRLSASLLGIDQDPERLATVKRLFGAEGFAPVALGSYEGLRSALSISDWDDVTTT
jgi:eukaryotic-like serine/threonine-protein kinase